MSSRKTPRTIISDYLDASKTQMVSPRRKQTRSVPRTPESSHKQLRSVTRTPESSRRSVSSGDTVLSHDRVASLRKKKRRSVSATEEEETPRQLIAQFLNTADTTEPLVRRGRRTSQSGVFASQPTLPVGNKRLRRSFHLDPTEDVESLTPRTLINRFLQNASAEVETPLVHHQSTRLSQESPEVNMVHDTYSTPSPFKESPRGSRSDTRHSFRERSSRRMSRSVTKSNYSLVIPESQPLSSPTTVTTSPLLQEPDDFHMPSPFRSSDSEEDEGVNVEENPLPDISRFHRKPTQRGYNLTVPDIEREENRRRQSALHDSSTGNQRHTSFLAGHQGNENYDEARDQSAGHQHQVLASYTAGNQSHRDYDDHDGGDQGDLEHDIDGNRRDSGRAEDGSRESYRDYSRAGHQLGDEAGNTSYRNYSRAGDQRGGEGEGGNQQQQQDGYRVYELPMKPAERSYEDIFTVPESSMLVDERSLSLSQQTGQHGDRHTLATSSPSRRAHSFNAPRDDVAYRRSPRRSEPLYRTQHGRDGAEVSPRRSEPLYRLEHGYERGDSSPVLAGRDLHKARREPAHLHSVVQEQFSPRVSSTQKSFHGNEPSETTSPNQGQVSPPGTVTPSPVVSPTRSDGSPHHQALQADATPQSGAGYSRQSGARPTPQSENNRGRRGRTPQSPENTRVGRRSSMLQNNSGTTDNLITPRSRRSMSRSDGQASETSSVRGSSGKRRYPSGESDAVETNFSPIIPDVSGRRGRQSDLMASTSHVTTSRSHLDSPASPRSRQEFASQSSKRIVSARRSTSRTPETRSRSVTTGSVSQQQVEESPRLQAGEQNNVTRSKSSMTTPRSSSGIKTPGSVAGTGSRSGTPKTRSRSPRSPRSPVVAGKMSRRANPDLVHTLPNTSANFSPPISSTQNIAAISRTGPDTDHRYQDLDPLDVPDDQDQRDVPEDRDLDPLHRPEDHDLGPLDAPEDQDLDPLHRPEDHDLGLVDAPEDRDERQGMEEGNENNEDYEDVEEENQENIETTNNRSTKVQGPQKKIQAAVRKPRQKNVYGIPVSLVKKRFTHYADMRVDKEAIKTVMDISEKYWDNLASDLNAYAKHAGRKRITKSDIELLFRRQGHVTEKQSLNCLIERHLPMEERERLIPCARAYSKVQLDRKYITGV